MSVSGGASRSVERPLNRKSSKSRLEKQQEVEDEDPPSGRTRCADQPQSLVSAETLDDAGKDNAVFQLTSVNEAPGHGGSLTKLQIPETRVESVDNADPIEDDKAVPVKSKVLVRSHAMCGDDDTKLNARVIEKQGSSKGSAGSSLSRDSSNELYTDSTGINLEDFITSTLHKNSRDRMFLLELEQTLVRFIDDTTQTFHRFPAMSSYNRMLVHRIAAFFGLDHNVDQSGHAVVVSKMPTTRLWETPFKDYIKHDFYTDDAKKMILKRDAQSYEECNPRAFDDALDIRKARSFEEREDEFGRMRTKIFNQGSSSSVEGIIESPARPWSSIDSNSDQSQLPGCMQRHRSQLMQKAGSFGGVPVGYRCDATLVSPRHTGVDTSRDKPFNVAFARQPTIPEASGTVPTALPSGQPVIFAVTSIEQVPPGAIIINPQTGQPYLNPDGTMHQHVKMPRAMNTTVMPPSSPSLITYPAPALADHPNLTLSGQMQQLNITSCGVNNCMETCGSIPAAPQVYAGIPQVYTVVVPHQATEATPIPQSSQQILSAPQTRTYMQPYTVQYQQPLGYAVPGRPIISETQCVAPMHGDLTTINAESGAVYTTLAPGNNGVPRPVCQMQPSQILGYTQYQCSAEMPAQVYASSPQLTCDVPALMEKEQCGGSGSVNVYICAPSDGS